MSDNPWKPYLDQVATVSVLPMRIVNMHKMYGKKEGNRCGDCKHLERHKQSARWFKCDLSRMTHSVATDWKAKWPACGRYIAAEREGENERD